MRFGIFFEIGVPRPFVDGIEQRVFHNALEQARLADSLGFHSVWAVEHHFLEEYSHSSAPELLLTAIAAQTERIRVGHGAVVCVPEINHPIRVAERAAVLDILSGGQLVADEGGGGADGESQEEPTRVTHENAGRGEVVEQEAGGCSREGQAERGCGQVARRHCQETGDRQTDDGQASGQSIMLSRKLKALVSATIQMTVVSPEIRSDGPVIEVNRVNRNPGTLETR